jgi:hypothetical protein
MATTWIKPLHRSGGISSALGNSLNYIKDKRKTNREDLIDSYECQPQTAQAEFLLSKKIYAQKTGRDQGKNDVIAYHIRMSFKKGEVTAEKALELGRELAMRWTRGKHQFLIAAHTNTLNPHVHIIYNSVTLDCDSKYQDFLYSYKALRRVSDQICLEHGLAVIENPGLSKGYNREEYLRARDGIEGGDSHKPPTVRARLQEMIDSQLIQIISAGSATQSDGTSSFEKFIEAMKNAGCEVKRGKHLAFKIPGAQRFIRCKSLGDDYEESAIIERLMGLRKIKSGEKVHTSPEATDDASHHIDPQHGQITSPEIYAPHPEEWQNQFDHDDSHKAKSKRSETLHDQTNIVAIFMPSTINKPNLLIDIQAKLQLAHSPGFEHFARIYNLKEMAKTLLLLQDWGIDDYDSLVEKGNAVSRSFGRRSGRIKEIQSRQNEISDLQKHIGSYSKTKDVFVEYNRLKKVKPSTFSKLTNAKSPAQIFYEENESAIKRCRAAKEYFDEQGYGGATGKKLPTIKSLQAEYAKLEAEKKSLWSGHKAERSEMIALKLAKQNVDMFLGEPKQKSKAHERSR